MGCFVVPEVTEDFFACFGFRLPGARVDFGAHYRLPRVKILI